MPNSTPGRRGECCQAEQLKEPCHSSGSVLCLWCSLCQAPALAHQACCLYRGGRRSSSLLHACLLRKHDSDVSVITWCRRLRELHAFTAQLNWFIGIPPLLSVSFCVNAVWTFVPGFACVFSFPSHSSSIPLPISAAGWNELLIASFSHRSIAIKDGILLATGLHVHRNSAHSAGVGAIFDRSLLPCY